MSRYIAVLFQTYSDAFRTDYGLLQAAELASGGKHVTLRRENYEDGAWSGWFSVTSRDGDIDMKNLAEKLTDTKGIVPGLMLKTEEGGIEPFRPAGMPPLVSGARLDKPKPFRP